MSVSVSVSVSCVLCICLCLVCLPLSEHIPSHFFFVPRDLLRQLELLSLQRVNARGIFAAHGTAQRVLGSYDTLAPLGHPRHRRVATKGNRRFRRFGSWWPTKQNVQKAHGNGRERNDEHAENLTHPLHPLQNPKIYPLPTLSLVWLLPSHYTLKLKKKNPLLVVVI